MMREKDVKPRPAAVPRNVARAMVIKAADIFFLSEPNGEIPVGNQDGFGLYYHDCRFLDGYTIQLAGTQPNVLLALADRGSLAQFELTNEKLELSKQQSVPPKRSVLPYNASSTARS